METIRSFRGVYSFLSNFFPAPVEFENEIYPSVENAFQAAKTEAKWQRKPFQDCRPGQAKRAGRNLMLRPNWDGIKERIMEDLLEQKFMAHPDLGEKLLTTGNCSLVEGNDWHDEYWGVCVCPQHKGSGQNRLGVLLMRVRARLRQVKEQAHEREGKQTKGYMERFGSII